MLDVKIEYSQVYWLHNQTLVPTTTTTMKTTTTTLLSTTKGAASSSSSSHSPMDKLTDKVTERSQAKQESSASSTLRTSVAVVALMALFNFIH